jgi:hypothetical protein
MEELSFFEIEMELKNSLDLIMQSSGEITEENGKNLERLNELLISKVDGVYSYRQSMQELRDVMKSRANGYLERVEQLDNAMERFDEYVNNCLSIRGVDEVSGMIAKIKKRKPSKVVKIIDETKIPIEFIKIPEVKPQVMKKEIADALKSGTSVEGAELCDSEKISIQYKLK